MWMQDLGDVYERGLISERIGHGVVAPQIAGPGLSYRDYKPGLSAPNIAAASLAGDVQFGNPTEQEEEGNISKAQLIKEIDALSGQLSNSPTDRVAIMVLGQLKKKIKNL